MSAVFELVGEAAMLISAAAELSIAVRRERRDERRRPQPESQD